MVNDYNTFIKYFTSQRNDHTSIAFILSLVTAKFETCKNKTLTKYLKRLFLFRRNFIMKACGINCLLFNVMLSNNKHTSRIHLALVN